MQRSATDTGPGIARSPNAHRRTVRASTSSAAAAATCDRPSDASAARNSSADNDAILAQRQAGSRQDGAQGVQRVVNGEGVGQAAVSAEQGQALRTISAGGDKTNGVGGQGGDGGGLAHNPFVGPMALSVNNQIAAAEASRSHGGEGGVTSLPGRPAHPMPRTSAHPSRPVAGRLTGASVRGVSSQPAATTAANYPAAGLPDAAAGAFWEALNSGAVRLTATEDQLVWDLRAAHWRWAAIAQQILGRRARLAALLARARAVRARGRYRRERGLA